MQSDDTALIAGVVGGVVGLLLLVGVIVAVIVARNRRDRRATPTEPNGTSSAALEPARASSGNYESLSAVHSQYDSSFLTNSGAKSSSPSPTNYHDMEMHPASNEYANGAIQPI